MRAHGPLLAAASLLLIAGPAFAQAAPAPAPAQPKPPAPTKEQVEDAGYEMRVLVSAIQSDKVEAPVKEALFECLYNNNFAKISDAIAKVIAQNPDKIGKRNPDQILGVMAGVCGYKPKPAAAAGSATPAPAPKPAPTPAKKPQGR